ncbi:MAG: hypothetical protein AB1700_13565 [Bacillota bacterium]
MTHSLHRIGPRESLENDIAVLFVPSKGVNHEGSAAKAKEFLKLLKKHGAVHYGDDRTGNVLTRGHDNLVNDTTDVTNVHAVFSDKDRFLAFLKDVVKADLGISVVVSGLFDFVEKCCKEAGAEWHTVEPSLGVWGRTEKLPPRRVLEVCTMCGHGYVTAKLVLNMVERIKKGRLSPSKAAQDLSRLCLCGIFNPDRAEKQLRALAETGTM